MKRAGIMYLIILLCNYNSIGQSEIHFPVRETKLTHDVIKQLHQLYANIEIGEELIISVLSEKELKKLENKDKIGFSRSRVNKLAQYCKDSLLINPLNLQFVFSPIDPQKKVISSTNAAYRNFTNRKGIYKLIISKPELYEFSGSIVDTLLYTTIMQEFDQTDLALFSGNYVNIVIPENAFDCSCEVLEMELKEYFNITDILLSGLTTTSGDKILETRGMMHLAAFCNGEEVKLNKNKYLKIVWKDEVILSGYQGFKGRSIRKMVDWELDQEIKVGINKKSLFSNFEMSEEENEYDNTIMN